MAKTDADSNVAAPPPSPTITGALSFDRATAGALLSLTLGRAGPVRPGALWSESKFSPALLSPPSADLALKVGAFDFGYGVGKGLSARLRIERGSLSLDDATLSLNGGRSQRETERAPRQCIGDVEWFVEAGRRQRRSPGLARKDRRRPRCLGRRRIGVVAGRRARGNGSLTVAETKAPRLDPDALARAMAKIEQAAGVTLEQNKLAAAIGAELDRGPLTIDKASSALAASSGVVRFGPFDAPARDGGATIAGALGLSDMSLSVQETLIDAKTGPFWKGPPPTVETEAKGSLDTLARKVDVSLLSAGLASEAIARESDRIANYEADLRERAVLQPALQGRAVPGASRRRNRRLLGGA